MEVLNVMDNNLLTFPASALESLRSLQSLHVDFNRISALTPSQHLNLTSLTLSNNLIRDIPAETFSNFPLLLHLNLEGNLIEKMDTVLLPNSLRTLNLRINTISQIPRFPLPQLEELDLSGNQVSTLLPHNFVLLPSLRKLDLSGNLVSEYFENTFDGLKSLETLDLARNNLGLVPKLGVLTQLKLLNVSKNGIKDMTSLDKMENLEVLDLSVNGITNIPPNTFTNSTNLVQLHLNRNKLNSFRGFEGKLWKLRDLDLSGNEITYVYPNTFDNLQHLWTLKLNGNRFTFFPTEFLRNCRNLRYIGLARNHIKNLNEMNFSNFPHLRHVDLSENSIEFLLQNTFLNSSQLQILNLSANKLESIESNLFHVSLSTIFRIVHLKTVKKYIREYNSNSFNFISFIILDFSGIVSFGTGSVQQLPFCSANQHF